MRQAGAGGPAPPGASSTRLHWRYALFAFGLALFTGGMVIAERHGLPRGWIGALFLVATVAVYAGIGLLSRTTVEAEYFVAGRRVPAVYNGLATAADWMSVASFIGTAGVLYLQGFAGLAYILGWTGGYCLLAILLAPYLRRFGQYTVPDFLGARYGGAAPRLIGAGATVLVSFVYVVVQIYGVGLITSHLTGFGFEVGIMVGLGGVLFCSFLGGMRAVTWTQVAQYLVLIVAYLVPLTWLSVRQGGDLLPMFSYGAQMEQIASRERALLSDPAELEVVRLLRERAESAGRKLADVRQAMDSDARALSDRVAALRASNAPLGQIQQAERELTLRPRSEAEARTRYELESNSARAQALPLGGLSLQSLPFAGDPQGNAEQRERFEHSRVNFIALVLCLMVGTAAMPHVLTRYYTTPSVKQARRSVGWSLFFITLLYLAAPAMAVLVKYEIFNHIVGLPIDQLPQWIYRWTKLDPGLVSIRDINGDGLLQLGELHLGADAIVLAAPEIGGLPYSMTCLVAAGGLAAALSTADGLLLSIANALSHDIYFRCVDPTAPALRRVVLSKLMVMVVALLAASIAALRSTDILQLVSMAFSLAAAAFFPALVLGIFWRRAGGGAAVAGMLAGLGVCLYYMATTTPGLRSALGLTGPAADSQWWGIEPVAAGVFGVPVGFAVMIVVGLCGRPADAVQRKFVDALRNPAADDR